MAMSEFLQAVQTARNIVLTHRRPPGWDEDGLRRAAGVWLTAHTAAAFDPDEPFPLTRDQRSALAAAVGAFRGIADATSGREPTPDEVREGVRQLWAAVELLEPYLDAEGRAVLETTRRLLPDQLPAFVLGLDYSLDTDWSGDPCIWVWVIIPDDYEPDRKEFRPFSSAVHDAAWSAVNWLKSGRIPYTRFRPASEVLGLTPEGDVA